MKNLITKVTTNREDLYEALQVYRNTPLEQGRSPAELLFNRKIRSNLPVVKTLLKPQKPSSEVKEKKKSLKQRQKRNYDKTTATLQPLNQGDTVRLQNMEKPSTNKPRWSQKGVVVKVLPNRSYQVRTETGEVLRRNRRHLLLTTKPEDPDPDEWYDAEEQPAADQPAAAAPPEPDGNHQREQGNQQPPAVRRSSRVSKPNSQVLQ